MRTTSIRARIQKRLVPLVLASWLCASLFVYFGTQSELQDALNAQKDVMATVIAQLLEDEIDPNSLGEGLVRYQDDYRIRVWAAEGELSFDSQTALSDGSTIFPTETGTAPLEPAWHVTEFLTQTGIRIEIARLRQETEELVNQIALTSLLPLGLALIASVVAALLFVRDGLEPLTRLSSELSKRSASDLSDLAQNTHVAELGPIVTSLNGLLDRMRRHLKRERRFVDDAAHELRTPLTVIKAQCQAIDRTVLTAEANERIDNVISGVDRMARLSASLLDQARAEQAAPSAEGVDAARILRRVIAELMNGQTKAGIRVELADHANPKLHCVADDFYAICRNLIENAIKFSGHPGHVLITLTEDMLTVEDDGDGIPLEQRDHVFERFGRLDQRHHMDHAEGTGLGLSIAKSLAARNGFRVSADAASHLQGALLRVEFCAE